MNKVYKVIWSKAKNCYVVASELAKNHTKSASGKAAKVILAVAVGLAIVLGGAANSYAADTTIGSGNGVSYGTGTKADADTSVALGKESTADSKSSIAIGYTAKVVSNDPVPGAIAIGKGAKVLNGAGNQEYYTDYDKSNWTPIFFKHKVKDATKLTGGIAIGTNAYARTGSVHLGGLSYAGKMGGIDVTPASTSNIVYMTTVGSDSFNKGLYSNIFGAHSIATGDFNDSNFAHGKHPVCLDKSA